MDPGQYVELVERALTCRRRQNSARTLISNFHHGLLGDVVKREIDRRAAAASSDPRGQRELMLAAVDDYWHALTATLKELAASQRRVEVSATAISPVVEETRDLAIEIRDHLRQASVPPATGTRPSREPSPGFGFGETQPLQSGRVHISLSELMTVSLARLRNTFPEGEYSIVVEERLPDAKWLNDYMHGSTPMSFGDACIGNVLNVFTWEFLVFRKEQGRICFSYDENLYGLVMDYVDKKLDEDIAYWTVDLREGSFIQSELDTDVRCRDGEFVVSLRRFGTPGITELRANGDVLNFL